MYSPLDKLPVAVYILLHMLEGGNNLSKFHLLIEFVQFTKTMDVKGKEAVVPKDERFK